MLFKCIFKTVPAAALLGAALLTSPLPGGAAPAREFSSDPYSETAITADLNELRTLLRQLNHDADQLNSVVLSRLHWQTHAFQLNRHSRRRMMPDRAKFARHMPRNWLSPTIWLALRCENCLA